MTESCDDIKYKSLSNMTESRNLITLLYVFELSNDKWFIHNTTIHDYSNDIINDTVKNNENNIQLEYGILYPYVKDNSPILSTICIRIIQDLEVDFFVKQYRRDSGGDLVRGGS